jgi:hypothetical protein
VGVAVAEPAEDVEDEDAILHGPAQVAERVRHGLHLPAELANGEIPLDEGPEARVEAESTGLSIAQKLTLECQPRLASRSGGANEVVEVDRDRAEDPGKHDAVQTQPRRSLDQGRRLVEDVVVEGVAAKSEDHQIPPPSVRGRLGVENDRDEKPDVLDTAGLVVELRDEGVSRVMTESRGGGGEVSRRAGRGAPPS